MPSVAIIPVAGLLVSRSGALCPVAVDGLGVVTGYDGVRASFALAFADDTVRAIVLDVDSDGGHVAGCLDLADLIHAACSAKPVRAILSETACDWAGVLASASEIVTVPRTGWIGGVGVLVAHMDYSNSRGVKVSLIRSRIRRSGKAGMRSSPMI